MKTDKIVSQPQDGKNRQPQVSLRVRTNLRAGNWNCNSCQGQVNGSTLFRPTCGYCQPA
jgi:hypothetical protein